MIFKDRKEAGIALAVALEKYKGEDVIVFALPRGGVPVGAEIARKLDAPLDLMITKKIGHPMNPEYAVCAIAEDGPPVCNPREVNHLDSVWLKEEIERVHGEIIRRREMYMGKISRNPVEGKVAILVDDGIATGLTMMASIEEMKKRRPKTLVVAIPVTPSDTAKKLITMVDDLVSLDIDEYYLGSVGAYYRDFSQVEDREVIALLESAKGRGGVAS